MTHRRQTWLRRAVTALFGLGVVLGAVGLGGCGAGEQADAGVMCESEGRPVHVGGTWILTGKGKRTSCSDPDLNHDFELGPATFEVVEVDPNQYDGGVQDDAAPQADARTDGPSETGTDGGDAGGAEAGADGGDGGATPDGSDGGGDDGSTGDGGLLDGGDDGGDGGDGAVPSDGSTVDAPADAPVDAAQVDAAPPVIYQPATLRLQSSIPDFDFQGTVRGECVSFDTEEVIPDVGNVGFAFRGAYESFGRRVEGTFTGKGPGSTCTASGTFTVEIQ
ncbi:MAG: hypothetical protein HY906_20545 [Deltaproteobacteria bacterium]|nr:hypothetical protein [Deltaproteobacteria bacterium]